MGSWVTLCCGSKDLSEAAFVNAADFPSFKICLYKHYLSSLLMFGTFVLISLIVSGNFQKCF